MRFGLSLHVRPRRIDTLKKSSASRYKGVPCENSAKSSAEYSAEHLVDHAAQQHPPHHCKRYCPRPPRCRPPPHAVPPPPPPPQLFSFLFLPRRIQVWHPLSSESSKGSRFVAGEKIFALGPWLTASSSRPRSSGRDRAAPTPAGATPYPPEHLPAAAGGYPRSLPALPPL